jgi:hypothetical protein
MPAYSSIGSLTLAVSGSQTSALGAGSLFPQASRLIETELRIILFRLIIIDMMIGFIAKSLI